MKHVQQTFKQRPNVTIRRRRGAVLLEAAITLPVLLFVVFGLLDLGMAVLRQNSLAEAARRGARAAIIHGDSHETKQTVWGSGTYTGTAADLTPQAEAVRPALVLMPPADVTLKMEWLDGKSWPGQRVRVTASYSNKPIFPFLIPAGLMSLHAVSTMRIAH
ncbi:MAG: TadE/TadG family type IV pilus assembly protein [Planctomycetaceae bacterium]